MRRGFSIVALSLALYTATLVLGWFAVCEASELIDALGEWATQGRAAQVKGCLLFLCDTQVWRRTESLCSRSR